MFDEETTFGTGRSHLWQHSLRSRRGVALRAMVWALYLTAKVGVFLDASELQSFKRSALWDTLSCTSWRGPAASSPAFLRILGKAAAILNTIVVVDSVASRAGRAQNLTFVAQKLISNRTSFGSMGSKYPNVLVKRSSSHGKYLGTWTLWILQTGNRRREDDERTMLATWTFAGHGCFRDMRCPAACAS